MCPPIKAFIKIILMVFLSGYILSACTSPPVFPTQPTLTAAPSISPSPAPTAAPSSTPPPTMTPSPLPTTTPLSTAEPSPSPIQVCSPLDGEPLAALSSLDLLKNPFVAPRPGYDDGHPGIDLAYWSGPDGKPMLGLPIHSVFNGIVAFTIQNRQPYGNAVVIETSLAQAPKIQNPTLPAKILQPSYSLACPDYADFKIDSQDTAIYVLYAHLNQKPAVKTGDAVACSQPIGEVGTTGRSVNPHLHLEVRLGPAGVRFTSMAHYDSSASEDEMRAYCLWRISGAFPPIDPLSILSKPSLER